MSIFRAKLSTLCHFVHLEIREFFLFIIENPCTIRKNEVILWQILNKRNLRNVFGI